MRVQRFDASVDLLRAVLWQYNDAPRLRALLDHKAKWYGLNFTGFWDDWYRDVFDLRTANDFGLTVWAFLLGVPLTVEQEGSGARPVFGFGDFNLNFNNGTFGLDGDYGMTLTVEQKRLILRLRYIQLCSTGNALDINRHLAALFHEGPVYVLDTEDMSLVLYVFGYVPDAQVRLVLEKFDLLPRPAGVEASYVIAPENAFGFAPYYLNFEHGTFRG